MSKLLTYKIANMVIGKGNIFRIFIITMVCVVAALGTFPASLLASNMPDLEKNPRFNSLSILPLDLQEKVQHAMLSVFGVQEPSKITVLQGGYSQTLYKLSLQNKKYVLRVINASLAERKREISSMLIAAKIGIAPRVYYANANNGIIIMGYIKKQKISDQDSRKPKTYKRLAILLRKIHHAPLFEKNINVFETVHQFVEQCQPTKYELIELAINKMQPIEKLLQKYATSASCHNDLNPNNILFDGTKFWVIDWENASRGDPYFDLATVSNFFIQDREAEDLYLKTYFNGIPSKKEFAHYSIMKQVALLYYGICLISISKEKNIKTLSAIDMQTLPHSRKDFLIELRAKNISLENLASFEQNMQQFGIVMLKEAIANMETKQFADAFNLLTN